MLVVAFPIAQGTSELFFTQDVDAGVVAYFLGKMPGRRLFSSAGIAIFDGRDDARTSGNRLTRRLSSSAASSRLSFGHVRTCSKMPRRRLLSAAG